MYTSMFFFFFFDSSLLLKYEYVLHRLSSFKKRVIIHRSQSRKVY